MKSKSLQACVYNMVQIYAYITLSVQNLQINSS